VQRRGVVLGEDAKLREWVPDDEAGEHVKPGVARDIPQNVAVHAREHLA